MNNIIQGKQYIVARAWNIIILTFDLRCDVLDSGSDLNIYQVNRCNRNQFYTFNFRVR